MAAPTAAQIVSVCRRLATRGFVAAFDGNVSARSGHDTILVTRTGLLKGSAMTRDVVSVSLDGRAAKKGARPTSELPLHLALYRASRDIGGVVHAHPPYATAFALSGIGLTPNVAPEVILSLGEVPLIPYAMPSSEEVGRSLVPFVGRCNAALLANHGAVAWGADVDEAWWRMEKLEHAARTEWIARQLGGPRALPPEQVERLKTSHPYARR